MTAQVVDLQKGLLRLPQELLLRVFTQSGRSALPESCLMDIKHCVTSLRRVRAVYEDYFCATYRISREDAMDWLENDILLQLNNGLPLLTNGCEATLVNVLSRHSWSFPTRACVERFLASGSRMQYRDDGARLPDMVQFWWGAMTPAEREMFMARKA